MTGDSVLHLKKLRKYHKLHKKLWEHMFDFYIAFSNALDIIRIVNDLSDAADGLQENMLCMQGVTIK